MRQVTIKDGKMIRDERDFFSFMTLDGRKVTTKADSDREARENIERTLNLKLKEAA